MNLNQLTIPVLDVERSIIFYRQLGLRLIVEALPHYARFECPDGESTFSLHQTDTALHQQGVWIYFEVANVDTTIENLKTKGLTIAEMPEDKPWRWREARLTDPDGHILILYHAGHNRKNPPWRIN